MGAFLMLQISSARSTKKVHQGLSDAGIRCELDTVPYMVIVGQKEIDATEISVRSRDDGDMGSIGEG